MAGAGAGNKSARFISRQRNTFSREPTAHVRADIAESGEKLAGHIWERHAAFQGGFGNHDECIEVP